MSPRIAVVIPCFNQGTFLEECLESVRSQSLQAAEVIVVDDGSTDPHTRSEMERLCVDGVRLVRQANRGLSGARNSGIREAASEWILPLDCDDQLTPDALEAFAAAAIRSPEIDIWVPDLQHFGLLDDVWRIPEFNLWRQLGHNQLVAGSLIRRRVFEDGYWYDETFKKGYEDWQFYIRVTGEGGFRVRPLERVAFRYRKWGYSMLASANDRAEELEAQIRNSAPALFGSESSLLAIKRASSPFLAISTELPAEAFGQQSFQDLKCVAPTKRNLSDFEGQLGAHLVVSLDDASLDEALQRDPFLLEKVARTLGSNPSPVLCLVSVEGSAAYPGRFVERPQSHEGQQCVAIVVATRVLFEPPRIADSGRGWMFDFLAHTESRLGHAVPRLIIGPHRPEHDTPRLVTADFSGAGYDPIPEPVAPTPRERIFQVARGLNKAARSLVGESLHDRIKQSAPFQRLKRELGRQPESDMQGQPRPEARYHPIPVPPDDERSWRAREAAWFVAHEPARHAERLAPDDDGALMVIVPWVIPGGADRAIVDLLEGLSREAPDIKKYLVATVPSRMDWSDRVLPFIDGFFSLPELSASHPSEAIAELADRLGVSSVMIANSQKGFDAVPALRSLKRRLRIIVQTHGFDINHETGELSGHPAYVASRYNNLVDGYANISRFMTESLTRQFYVSPSKQQVVYLGVDVERLRTAYRPDRFTGETLELLWLGRLPREKDPLLALRILARWKARRPGARVRLVLAGGGPLESEVRRKIAALGLEDCVDAVGVVRDPFEVLSQADCLLMTSRYEGIPVVAYEAMACGVPLIAPTRHTAIPEVLSAEDAYFIERREDLDEYVSVFDSILRNPAEANAKSRRLLECASAFSTRRYVQETLEVLYPARRELLRAHA